MKYAFTTLLLATVVAGDCAADNCLRALRATSVPTRLADARAFCGTFTAGSVAPTAIPSYAISACKPNQNGGMEARISSACSCIAASTTTAAPTTTSAPTVTAACALVSISSAAQRLASPSATPTVAATLAHDCLNSIPLNKTAALALVDSMVPYLEWQSDTYFKKNPPATYEYPAHDIFGYLASVKAGLQADKYANEYEFQEDLYQVFARGHDGHFVFYPDALTKAFEWARQRSVVSISEDGTSLPVIKLYEDVIASPSTASVVTLINGEDAATYIGNFAYTASFNQDKDAAYNTMFFEKAFVAGGTGKGYFSSGGRVRYIYPGANTTFTFANGTTLATENVAKVKGAFAGVVDGKSFYTKFCTPPAGVSNAAALAEEVDVAADIVNPGYPAPVVITSDGIVSGYYLDGEGFEDVAVISLLAFESDSITEFQSVAQTFFADAKRDGKTKLVIDLSANGGGYILQGYDLFRQLFPTIVQDGFSRWRESDTFNTISEIFSANSANFNPDTATSDQINQYETPFNYRYDLNVTDQPFLTFPDKFGPVVLDGVDYTELMRWNLNDPLTTSNDTYGLGTDVTGYGSRQNFTQPFEAENIIMLLDGYCASTCTLFSEFMRTQAGVKNIAMGGRPKTGPIQGVGGIKGAQILAWTDIYSYAQSALETASPEQAAILNRLTPLAFNRASTTGVNVRDNILPDHIEDGLPAQFVQEETDCRLYWTLPMITDVTAVWKAVANSAFNGAACAAGAIAKRDVKPTALPRRPAARPTVMKPVKRRAASKKSAEWRSLHEQMVIQ